MAFLRKNENDEVLVFLNLSKEKTGFVIQDQLISGNYTNVFNGSENHLTAGSFISMMPWDYTVLEKKAD